jgi:hypothetical protein
MYNGRACRSGGEDAMQSGSAWPFHPVLASAHVPAVHHRQKRDKAQLAALNQFILDNGGWITSVNSNPNIRFETTNAALPEALRGSRTGSADARRVKLRIRQPNAYLRHAEQKCSCCA